jgi:hypothetical protein
LRGIAVTSTVSYCSIPREQDGAIYAEEQGVIMTKEDNNNNVGETATWTENSTHYFGQTRKDVGSIFCRTSSNGKLAFLNDVVGVFEYEADEIGTSRGKIWE